MDPLKSKQLWDAATEGNLPLVQQLCQDPSVNLNWRDGEDLRSPFYRACFFGRTEVVRFFLGLKEIEVTLPHKTGGTPLYIACQEGHVGVVSLLLADNRFDINKPRHNGSTPLWIASNCGHLHVVKHLFACGRGEIDTKKISDFDETTAAAHARWSESRTWKYEGESDEDFQRSKVNGPKIADLIESFERNPRQIRAELRRVLFEPLAGELFALVVFLSDRYLEIPRSQISSQDEKFTKAHKFFTLALQLSMDLQMVLCNRVFGLEDSIIRWIHSEEGFRKFANQGF